MRKHRFTSTALTRVYTLWPTPYRKWAKEPMDDLKLFDRLGPQKIRELWRGIYYRVRGDRELAQEIMQDTLVRAMESIHQLREGEKLEGWLATIAKNKCYDHLRKQNRYYARHRGIDEDDDYDTLVPSISASAEDIALLNLDIEERLAFAKDQPDEIRQIIYMHGIDGMTFTEIGKVLGVSPETAKTKFYRAIWKFKAQTEEVRT